VLWEVWDAPAHPHKLAYLEFVSDHLVLQILTLSKARLRRRTWRKASGFPGVLFDYGGYDSVMRGAASQQNRNDLPVSRRLTAMCGGEAAGY